MKCWTLLLTGITLLSQPGHAAAQGGTAATPDQLKVCCQKISRDIQRIYYLANRNGKIRLVVRGIYARNNKLFFSLRLANRSSLDYEVDSIRFFVAERQKGVPALHRVSEVKPLFLYDTAGTVPSHSKRTCVIVIPRVTLQRRYRLQIEVMERNRGRRLRVEAANFTLQTARLI